MRKTHSAAWLLSFAVLQASIGFPGSAAVAQELTTATTDTTAITATAEDNTDDSGEIGSGDPGDPLIGENIIRVEEDWIVDVADPDPALNIPQIVTVFGPDDPNTGLHAVFELNHSTSPDYSDGGMQLQCWWRDSRLASRRHLNPSECSVAIERIRYTTVVQIQNHKMSLAIKNGNSVTFGDFGGDRQSRLVLSSWRSNLNNYDADSSIKHSRVSYGANRVNRFLRAEIRYYTADGDTIIDETDTFIHELPEAQFAETPVNVEDSPAVSVE